jgi:CheY-like chemotaxis protein
MLRDLLELWGHQVEVAEDGYKALDLAQRRMPDVALVDIGLPGLSGYQVAQQVRTMPGGAAVLLLALTGYSQPEDRRRARAAGFDAHLAKPAVLDELARMLALKERPPADGPA